MRTSAELGTKESMWSGLARETRPEEKPVMIPLAVLYQEHRASQILWKPLNFIPRLMLPFFQTALLRCSSPIISYQCKVHNSRRF